MTLIRLKRFKAADWASDNPILDHGEPGFEVDTGRVKIGRDSIRWNDLPYIGDAAATTQVVATLITSALSGTTTIPIDGTIPQITEGFLVGSVNVTPTVDDSKLIVTANLYVDFSLNAGFISVALFLNGAVNAVASNVCYAPTATGGQCMTLVYVHQVTDLNPLLFEVRAGTHAAGTTRVNGGLLHGAATTSTIVAQEVRV